MDMLRSVVVIILKVLNKIKYGLENITGKTAMDT